MCVCVCIHARTYVCMCYACMHASIFVCMHACMHLRRYVRMYVSMDVYCKTLNRMVGVIYFNE